ncbi:uncharacterized protein LOC133456267 [Cololabis saira]|uniref:uncharacterized protein LOC133456267 n=1 Tax=Cololabis saira TaxID=129043 RepID=UPI002AD41D7C|nr:uncharacterized protein LOC133456267 [Cololabis saira]
MMKTLCVFWLFHASLQLQCDKKEINAHVGGEFKIACNYERRLFFSKKYWCRGPSRNTCEVLVDTDKVARTKYTHRSQIKEVGRAGLFVRITNLQTDDSGVYWIGIDKPNADIMTSVTVVITEAPVSKPSLRPLSPLVDRPTCWGEPVTVRCASAKGTAIDYTWYQHTHREDLLLHHSPDLNLHCGAVAEDSEYFCCARNSVSNEKSDLLSVEVLMPADLGCIYVVKIQGQPIYDCADRMSTTTEEAAPLTACQTNAIQISDPKDQFSPIINQTHENVFFSRTWSGFQLWYTLLRWGSLGFLLLTLFTVLACTRTRRKSYAKRKKFHYPQIPR